MRSRTRPRRLTTRRSTCLRGPYRRPSGSPQAHQAAHQRRAPIRQGPGTSTSPPRSVPAGDHRGGIGIPVQKRSTLQLVHLARPAASPLLRRRQPAKRQSIRDLRLPPPARCPCGCAHGPCRSVAAPARWPMRRTAQAQPVGHRSPADIHQGGPCSRSGALGRPLPSPRQSPAPRRKFGPSHPACDCRAQRMRATPPECRPDGGGVLPARASVLPSL